MDQHPVELLSVHLLECAGQLTGGYFADPGYKDVPGLDRLGFPIAEIDQNGAALLTKLDGSGGMLTIRNCKEQTLLRSTRPFTLPPTSARSASRNSVSIGSASQARRAQSGRPI